MKRTSKIIVFLTLLFAFAVSAQAQMEMPKPGPEHKKLDYFLGTWTMDGDLKPGPMGPGGKMNGTTHVEWMDGGFFVVMHSDMKGASAMSNGTGTAFMGYNSDEKKYTYNEFNSAGQAVAAMGTVDGDTWNWTSEEKMGGMSFKGRYTMKILSPTSYTFKYEMSQDGSTWTTMMDGKSTKTK